MIRKPTWFEVWYTRHLNETRRLYMQMADTAARRKGEVHAGAWQLFEDRVRTMLDLADINAAGMIHFRATQKGLIVPPGAMKQTEADIPKIVEANPWMRDHRFKTEPVIASKAEVIRQVEEEFIRSRHDALRRDMLQMGRTYHVDKTKTAGADIRDTAAVQRSPSRERDIPVPIYRLEMHRRNSIAEIATLSEQVALSDPAVGSAFPMASYFTRDDLAVRPTHKAMYGFVARRNHQIWTVITPPCSWNCRCMCRYYTLTESIRKGWMTKDGQHKFDLKWPNTASRMNYESGKFPDNGWKGPKAIAP